MVISDFKTPFFQPLEDSHDNVLSDTSISPGSTSCHRMEHFEPFVWIGTHPEKLVDIEHTYAQCQGGSSSSDSSTHCGTEDCTGDLEKCIDSEYGSEVSLRDLDDYVHHPEAKYLPTPAHPNDELPQDSQLTVLEATYTNVGMLMNNGVFSLPFVFARSGFSSGFLILAVTTACVYTAWLVGDVLAQLGKENVSKPTYYDAAKFALGSGFASIVTMVFYAELAVYGTSGLIVQGHTLHDLLPSISYEQVVLITAGLTSLLAAIPDKAYSYVSLLSAISLWLVCLTVLASGWALPEWACATRFTSPATELAPSISMILFNAATHPLLPSLYTSTGSKEKFQRATRNAWGFWGVFVFLFGAATYYMFGDGVQAVATRNIGRDAEMKPLPGLQGLAAFASSWFLFRNQLSMRAFISPYNHVLATAAGLEDFHAESGGRQSIWISIPVLLACTLAAMMLKEEIAGLMSFSGRIFMNLNAIVFPSLMYLRVCNPEQTIRWFAAALMCLFGMTLIVLPWSLSLIGNMLKYM